MYRKLYVALLAAPLLTACVVAPPQQGHEYGYAVAPALPVVVELGVEPYYYHGGYYYYYVNNNWRYSNAKAGPWRELPRDRYPREVRFQGRGQGQGNDHDKGHGNDHNRGQGGDDRYRN